MEKRNRDILEKAYPALNITDETINDILKRPKFFRGHVRTAMGRIYTTEGFRKRSDEVLKKQLP